METGLLYSSSIQKIVVFINPQLEISGGGIAYFNTFLNNLGDGLIIETINSQSRQQSNNKSKQQSYLSSEAIQEAVNAIFPYEMSEYIIDQSQGRIQHTSMKNLPAYKPYNDDDDEEMKKSREQDDDEEDDDDVEGFEIIPRDSTATAQSISLFFPTELVFAAVQKMIERKKKIGGKADYYEPVELQSKDSILYTFLSYCMESVTTRILKKLSETRYEINEDVIRKTIEADSSLKEIRHKVVQITNTTNRLLQEAGAGSLVDLSSSLTSSILYPSTISNSNSISNSSISSSIILNQFNPKNNNNSIESNININNNNNNDVVTNENVNNLINSDQQIKKEIENKVDNNITTTTTTIDNNNAQTINNTVNIPTPNEEEKIIDSSSKQSITPIISNIIEKDLNSTSTTATTTTTTPSSPASSSTLKNRKITPNQQEEMISQLVQDPIKRKEIQSLFVNKQYDLLELLRDGHLYLEAKNGTFLVLLILLGLALQSFTEVC